MDIKNKNKLLFNKFIGCAKEAVNNDNTISEAILIKRDNEYGILYVSLYSEKLDNHCDKCMDESPLFLKFKEYDDMPSYFVSDVGPTKLEKIIKGEIGIYDFKIICDLLDQKE